MTTELPRLVRERLPDRVATELKRLVMTWAPNTRLPSIRELAKQLGVTHLTIREALAQLETCGLIRTRHGSGTYVVDVTENPSLGLLAETLSAGRAMTRAEIESLLAFREVVIVGFVDAIAKHATPDHIARLQAIVDEEKKLLARPDELAARDFHFNEVLAEASGNLFYTLLLRAVREAHTYLGTLVFRHADTSVVVGTHESIVRALRKGDAAAVGRRVHTYLTGGNAIVADWLKRQPK